MKNKERKIRLLEMVKSCIREEVSKLLPELEELLKSADLDYHEKCFVLFLIGEYTRISQDTSLYERDMEQIQAMQEEIRQQAYEPHSRIASGEEGIYGDNYGMAYGALYNSNLFAKDEKTAKAVHGMKNYAYEHFTCAGKLVDEQHGEKATAQLLWICVPFGLFTPEDLVLVAALDEIQDTQRQEDLALLGWYFAEKTDYRKSRSYLARLKNDHGFVQAVKEIIEEKLRLAGMLSEAPILHVPCGNFNRYSHQNYEREPWFPKEGDKVFLNAAAWPVQLPLPVEAVWESSAGKRGVAAGAYQPEYENYRFQLGEFTGGEEITYYFQTGDYCSEKFRFTVLAKESVTEAGNVVKTESGKVLELRTDRGGYYLWSRRVLNGQIMDCVIAAEAGKISTDIDGWRPFSERREIPGWKGDEIIPIEEISFWKENERIFSAVIRAHAEDEERFYGFGERYNHIDQRGNVVDVYVYNQYKDQGMRTYFPMPYFLSSGRYGLWIATDRYTEFDMCAARKDAWEAEAETEELCWYTFSGTPKEMIGQFTAISGRPAMMPEWAFGPWMSSNNWDSEAEVRKQVELTKKYDIPSTVLVIEAWSDEATYYIFNDAVYKENQGEKGFSYEDFSFPEWGRWPDPKGMVEYLHKNGLKCILWQIPIVKYINSLHHIQKDRDEAYALEQGYCAKKKDGTPYRMPEGWFTDSLLVDFTSPEAAKWYMDKRKYLVEDIKIDGFKTDGGEFVFGDDVQFADGRTGREMRNAYPNLYIREHYNYIHEKRDGIVFSRAGYTGAAAMPAHWAGDERSTFSAFKRNLCAGLNAGISGVPFWGWDLAGFSGEIPSAELYARSASMAAFCPIMQYHAESKAEFNQDRTPWNIAERRNAPWVIDAYRKYAKLRMAMLPYIMEETAKCCQSGVPMMRALWVEFPQDNRAGTIFDQYMFGDELMVAPVVEEGMNGREVYVPQGEWRNIFTGECFSGNETYYMKAEVDEIIVLQRKGSPWKISTEGKFLFEKISK